MPDTADTTTSRATIAHQCKPPGGATFLLQSILLSVPAAAIAWLLRVMVDHHPTQAAWTLEIVIAVAAIFACYWSTLHCRRVWSRPTQRLLDALVAARDGQIPIDELSEIGGGVAPLVPVVQD